MVKRRVLVTGATGGLGRTLVPTLLRGGHAVTATGRNARIGAELSAFGADFVAADLVSADLGPLLAGIDAVFHLAARSAPWGSRADFQRANVIATARLLAAARAAGCRRFVYASTPSVYAEARDRLNLTEASPVARHFANLYASSKYQAERLVLAADGPGFRTLAIRPRAIIGPHDTVLLPRLLRVARRGRFPLPRKGAALIEISDVRDVADAFVAALDADRACGRAINVSGGAPRTVREIVRAACAAMDLSCRLYSVPVGLVMGAARVLELVGEAMGREPAITRYSVMTLAWSQTFDLSGAADLLGWRPRRTPEEAISHAAQGLSAKAVAA